MVSAGMPELMETDDITYLRDQMCLDKSDKEACMLHALPPFN
jgi:hypothetical protein